MGGNTAPTPWRKRLAALAAWVVTLGVLAFLFWRIPVNEVLVRVASAAWWMLPAGVLALAAIFFADSLATWSTFGRLLGPIPLGGLFVARGASYLLAALNYVAGQGALLYFVSRAHGIRATRVGSAVMVIAVANFFILLCLAAVGLSLAPDAPVLMTRVAILGFAGTAVYAALLVAKPVRLGRYPIVGTLFEAGIKGHAWATLVRIPHVLALMAYSFAMLRAFAVRVPLEQALFALPIVYVIAFIPISIQGLGTTQAVMLLLFSRFVEGPPAAREAAVLASSLTAFAVMTGVQWLMGLLCLRTSLGRSLRDGVELMDAERTQAGHS